MSNSWKAVCVKRINGAFWSIGDIIVVEDDRFQYATNHLGEIMPMQTERLSGDKFIGITDLNFKIAGAWELVEQPTEQPDAINPSHYKECSLECIDAMLMAFGADHVYMYCCITAWKYMWRYENKNGIEDIKKARWYIEKAKELGHDQSEVWNLEYVLEKIEKVKGIPFMLKSCSYCRKIHERNFICPEKEKALKEHHGKKQYKSKYEMFEETNVDGFRSTKAWQLKRAEIRQRDRNLCQICFRELYNTIEGKKLNYNNLSVHHCEPLNESYEKRLDNSNLLCVCEYHHRLCDNGTIPQEEVKRIIEEQEKKENGNSTE